MQHGIYRVTAFDILAPYVLRVRFSDGTSQDIDFAPVLAGELYGALKDLDVFNGVKLDEEAGTLVWPNGADFDPTTLHDWPQVSDGFTAMARTWRRDGRKPGSL